MNAEWFIAKRYLRSKRRHPFVGLTATIAVVGIAVGVAALIVVMAVMNGFDEELKKRIIGLRAHLVIQKEAALAEAPLLIQKLEKSPVVKGVAPFVEGQALFRSGPWVSGVLVRGVDVVREGRVSNFHQILTQGSLKPTPDSVVIGSELAKRAHLSVGAEIELLSQNKDKPSFYHVDGIFSSGMYEYDANVVFMDLKSASDLFMMTEGPSGLSVALEDPDKAAEAGQALQRALGYPYQVLTWMEMNKTLFGALKLEKFVMFLILVLILVVASLNIAGSLTLLVMDKTRQIGVLKALGLTRFGIAKIFTLDGLWIGGLGAALGFAGGLGICFLLARTKLIELPKEIYYMDRLPVQISSGDVLSVMGAVLFLSLISTFYPAITAGRLDPVKALRYE